MAKATEPKKLAGLGDDAVKRKTGKSWSQWLAILDRAGGRKMSHTAIATYLNERQKVPGWWCQMVAVGYEQARGMREKHQRLDGYAISVSRTIGVPVPALFRAWSDPRSRSRWLPRTPIVIRKATPSKSMRVTWTDKKSSLEVNFYPRGTAKGQVVVQHAKLPDAKAAARMKAYWAKTLDRLREVLEA